MATKQEKMELLGGVPFLSDLSKRDLNKVLDIAKPTVHTEGAEVMTEGRGGVGFHLITDGKAKVQRGGRTVATLGPGEFFGEMALVDDGPRSASVLADTDLTTLVISKWEFRPPGEVSPRVGLEADRAPGGAAARGADRSRRRSSASRGPTRSRPPGRRPPTSPLLDTWPIRLRTRRPHRVVPAC